MSESLKSAKLLLSEHNTINYLVAKLKYKTLDNDVGQLYSKLQNHIVYEEEILFPALAADTDPVVVQALKDEHASLLDQLTVLQRNILSEKSINEKIIELGNHIMAHNHREEVIIYGYIK